MGEQKRRSVFSALGADRDRELGGIEVVYFGDDLEITIRIARAGGRNDAFRKKSEELTRPFRRAGIDIDQLPIEKQREVMRELYIDTVILGWSGVYDDDGNEIPFNRENAMKVFTAVPDLLDFVVREAQNFQNFRIATRANEAKN